MALSVSDIVQQAAGSTGAATTSTVTPTLPSGTATGRTLLIVVVADTTVATPAGFVRDVVQVNNDGHYLFHRTTTAGETSWAVALNSASAACWWVAEVSGLASAPFDAASVSDGSSGQASSFSTGTTGPISRADSLLLATVGTSAATNPGATSTAWTNGFTQQATTSTTRPSGTNVGLGVAVRFPGAVATYETTASTAFAAHTAALTVYSGAPPGTQRDVGMRAGDPVAGWSVAGPRAGWAVGSPAGAWQVSNPT